MTYTALARQDLTQHPFQAPGVIVGRPDTRDLILIPRLGSYIQHMREHAVARAVVAGNMFTDRLTPQIVKSLNINLNGFYQIQGDYYSPLWIASGDSKASLYEFVAFFTYTDNQYLLGGVDEVGVWVIADDGKQMLSWTNYTYHIRPNLVELDTNQLFAAVHQGNMNQVIANSIHWAYVAPDYDPITFNDAKAVTINGILHTFERDMQDPYRHAYGQAKRLNQSYGGDISGRIAELNISVQPNTHWREQVITNFKGAWHITSGIDDSRQIVVAANNEYAVIAIIYDHQTQIASLEVWPYGEAHRSYRAEMLIDHRVIRLHFLIDDILSSDLGRVLIWSRRYPKSVDLAQSDIVITI